MSTGEQFDELIEKADPHRVGKTREMPEELAAEFRNAVDGYMKEGEGRPRRKRLGTRKAR